MNVLLFCPVHPYQGVYPETLSSIRALDRTGHSVTVHFEDDTHVDKSLGAYDQITQKFQIGRRLLLEAGFDALLTVEADNIVPPDALQKLAAIDADVAHGLYCNRHTPHRWLAAISTTESRAITYSRNEPTAQAAWNQVVESQGIGFGCTLIHRRVLEAIEFRRRPGHPCANDWTFAMDCIEQGFSMAHDCSVHVGHIFGAYRKTIIWPQPVEPFHRLEVIETRSLEDILSDKQQAEYICTTTIFESGDGVYYQPGEIITLVVEQARPLIEAGVILPKPETPQAEPEPIAEPATKQRKQKDEDS